MADYARAERLRELRAATHMSRENVANEIGVTTKTLYEWENGGKIRWENAQKLAAFYTDKLSVTVTAEELVSRELIEPTTPVGGVSQLDRIEAKLDAIIAHFKIDIDTEEAIIAGAEQALSARRGARDAGGSEKRSGSKRAAPRARSAGKRSA
jgi:transcriptional regulator with XRE-family HTH domain